MTRWFDYLLIFNRLQQRTFAQLHQKVAKVGSKFCQVQKLPKTKWQNLAKSSHIESTTLLLFGRNEMIDYQLRTVKTIYKFKILVPMS